MSQETATNDNRTFIVGFLRDFAREHPKPAAIIFAGLAAFLAVALVQILGIEPEARVQSAFILIAVGIGVLIAVDFINDALVMRVLRWMVLILFGLWLVAVALHKFFPKSPEFACMTYVWLNCRDIYNLYDKPVVVTPPQTTTTNPIAPQAGVLPKAPPGADKVEVVFQFAGLNREQQVKPVMRDLQSAGWLVLGVEQGGHRVGSAADKQEVRYGDKALEPLAKALAEAMNMTKLTQWTVRPTMNPAIKDQLEVWVGPNRPKEK